MTRLGFIALVAVSQVLAAQAQPASRPDLKPGLVFSTSVAGRPPLSRVEPTVGLTLAAGEAAHPQAADATTFRWVGTINVLQAGKYRFDAVLLGTLEVKVAATTVLSETVTGSTSKSVLGPDVQLPAGFQPFQATLKRSAPAVRLELLWSGPGFRAEPVPYSSFSHLLKQRPDHFAADLERDHGRLLFEELSCVRCHKSNAAILSERTGPALSDIGQRVFPGWLDAWLANPQHLRTDTVMPAMFDDDVNGVAERYAVVAYLTSLGGPLTPSSRPISPGDLQRSLVNGQKLYVTAGCAACHTNSSMVKTRKDDPDEEEKPVIRSEDSAYAIGTSGPKSNYRLGALGSKTRPETLAKYLENPLATNPHGRMPNMGLSGSEARDLARYLYRQADESISRGMPPPPRLKPMALFQGTGPNVVERWRFARLTPSVQWRTLGRSLVTSKGCVNCHAIEPGGQPLPELASVTKLTQCDPSAGCLSATPTAGMVPRYKLDARQRASLAAFVKSGLTVSDQSAPTYQARVALRRFNCLACHTRDGEGGLDLQLADRMRLLEKAENADDVSPPRLTGAGHKLRTAWLHQVLTQSGRARPWMTLRMPQYGQSNVGFLVDALPKLEGTFAEGAVGKIDVTPAKVEAGRILVGKNGHGCISCHDISGVVSGGTRGPDLALTSQRVRPEWYARWMHLPQRIAPGTRMPQVAIDGKALLTSVFDGDADRQFDAMWTYFALGPGLPLPAGLEPPKGVVVTVKNRPEVLRTFLPDGAGSKAIAVGYPGGVSVAFDAAQCRLGYAWSGNFLDASPVWNNRGGSPARLLGSKFWSAPAGFPWHVTEGKTLPDIARRAVDPTHGVPLPDDRFHDGPRLVHFDGYSLDSTGNPRFRYSLLDADGKPLLTIAEKPEPLPVTIASGLRRRFTVDLTGKQSVWFLAGTSLRAPRVYTSRTVTTVAPRIGGAELPADGTRLVLPQDGDGAIVLDLTASPSGSVWRFVRSPGGGWQALLQLPAQPAAATVSLDISIWGLPRDDEQLLQGLRPGSGR